MVRTSVPIAALSLGTILPKFLQLMSIIGSIFGLLISLFIPLLCYRKLFKNQISKLENTVLIVFLIISVFLMITGLIASLTVDQWYCQCEIDMNVYLYLASKYTYRKFCVIVFFLPSLQFILLLLTNVVSYHIISYHIISYHIISYHISSYQIIWYNMIWYDNSLQKYHKSSAWQKWFNLTECSVSALTREVQINVHINFTVTISLINCKTCH